jgi:hypothetical protein
MFRSLLIITRSRSEYDKDITLHTRMLLNIGFYYGIVPSRNSLDYTHHTDRHMAHNTIIEKFCVTNNRNEARQYILLFTNKIF